MDPDACMKAMLEAIRERDRTAAIEAMEDMAAWLQTGGAFPEAVIGLDVDQVELTLMGLSAAIAVATGLEGSNLSADVKKEASPKLRAISTRLLAIANLDG